MPVREKAEGVGASNPDPELRLSHYLPSACRSDWHGEIKACAGSRHTLHPDASLMHRHEAFGNEQAQLSALSGGVGRRHFREFVKELFDVMRLNPAAGIGNRSLDKAFGGRLEIDGDTTARRCELNRIAHELPDELFQFILVSPHRWEPISMHDLDGNH